MTSSNTGALGPAMTPCDRGPRHRKECPTTLGTAGRAGGSGRSLPGVRLLFRPPPGPRAPGERAGRGAGRRAGPRRQVGLGRAHVRTCVLTCVGAAHSTLCARRMSGPAGQGLRTRWRKAEAAVSDRMRRPRNPSSGP